MLHSCARNSSLAAAAGCLRVPSCLRLTGTVAGTAARAFASTAATARCLRSPSGLRRILAPSFAVTFGTFIRVRLHVGAQLAQGNVTLLPILCIASIIRCQCCKLRCWRSTTCDDEHCKPDPREHAGGHVDRKEAVSEILLAH